MHKRYSNSFFCLLAFVLTGFIFSGCEETVDPETFGSISGQVTYAATGEPVANASITTNPPTEALLTTEEGTFLINQVPTGDVTVTIQKPNFATETRTIRVREGQTPQVFVELTDREGNSIAPLAPREPAPAPGSLEQPTNLDLSWSPAEGAEDDSLIYDLILYESDSTNGQLVAQDLSDTTFTLENLRANTVHYWQLITKDQGGNTTVGPIWTFRTGPSTVNQIYFARNVGDNYEIFSTDTTENARIQRLTNRPSLEWRPLLSPLRDRIAFTSNSDVEKHIYLATPEGRNPVKVTTVPVAGYHNNGLGFTWSPDGGELLYSHYDLLYRINRGGYNLQAVALAPEGKHWRELDWTAQNGGKIVAQAIGMNIYNSEIYLMDADGSNMTLLVEDHPGRMGGPVFSIDGNQVLYTRDVSGFESEQKDGRQLDSHIFLLDLSTGIEVDLSQNKPAGTNDLMPRFNSNGSQIIFVNTSNDGLGKSNIYVMDTDGTGRELVVEDGTTPSWN